MKVEISIGEALDKLSILKIKLDNIKDVDKLHNIKTEYTYLSNKLKTTIKKEIAILYHQLYVINTELWDIEDKIREKERLKEFDAEFIEIARSVYIKNDIRSKIKYEINIKCKSLFIEVKSYA